MDITPTENPRKVQVRFDTFDEQELFELIAPSALDNLRKTIRVSLMGSRESNSYPQYAMVRVSRLGRALTELYREGGPSQFSMHDLDRAPHRVQAAISAFLGGN